MDLGTGDGRAVLAAASAHPNALVIGIDASAAAMAETSRRADRGRSSRPNALFLVEAAERLPGPLEARASVVSITLPWGSLLRGVLGLDRRALAGIASIVARDGRVVALVSVVPADRVDGVVSVHALPETAIADAWRPFGFELISRRPATGEELLATRSSWARRLGDRPVWRLELHRCGP